MNFQSKPSMNRNKRELINRIHAFRIISEFRFYAVGFLVTSNLTLTNVCGSAHPAVPYTDHRLVCGKKNQDNLENLLKYEICGRVIGNTIKGGAQYFKFILYFAFKSVLRKYPGMI